MTDWRAVGVGAGAAAVYLAVLAAVPGLTSVRIEAIPLLLGTGLVAGSAAGLRADAGPDVGAWHGLVAGSVAGAGYATVLVVAFAENLPLGVFHGLNHVVATEAGKFPVIATRGPLVVAGIAGVGWAVIAALGLVAGRQAPLRETRGVLVE